MTDIVWPSDRLGLPLKNGYQVTVNSKQQQKRVLGGMPRLRAQNPLGALTCRLNFRFTEFQMISFRGFYEVVLNFGKEYFLLTMRTATGVQRMPVLILNGYTYRLVGASSYDVSFTVAVKKEEKTIEPDPEPRGVIDALYALSPAGVGVYDSRRLANQVVDPVPQ